MANFNPFCSEIILKISKFSFTHSLKSKYWLNNLNLPVKIFDRSIKSLIWENNCLDEIRAFIKLIFISSGVSLDLWAISIKYITAVMGVLSSCEKDLIKEVFDLLSAAMPSSSISLVISEQVTRTASLSSQFIFFDFHKYLNSDFEVSPKSDSSSFLKSKLFSMSFIRRLSKFIP